MLSVVWSKPAAPPRIRLVLSRAECNKEEQHPGARELRRALLMGWVGNEAGPLVHGAARRAGPAASSGMRRCAQVPGQRRRRRRRPRRELRGADDDGVAARGQQADGGRVNVAAAAVVTLTGGKTGDGGPIIHHSTDRIGRLLLAYSGCGRVVAGTRYFFSPAPLCRWGRGSSGGGGGGGGTSIHRSAPELGPSAARLPATARCRAAAGAVTGRRSSVGSGHARSSSSSSSSSSERRAGWPADDERAPGRCRAQQSPLVVVVGRSMDARPCSVIESIVALALRCEAETAERARQRRSGRRPPTTGWEAGGSLGCLPASIARAPVAGRAGPAEVERVGRHVVDANQQAAAVSCSGPRGSEAGVTVGGGGGGTTTEARPMLDRWRLAVAARPLQQAAASGAARPFERDGSSPAILEGRRGRGHIARTAGARP